MFFYIKSMLNIKGIIFCFFFNVKNCSMVMDPCLKVPVVQAVGERPVRCDSRVA